MTVKELKQIVSSIPEEFDNYELVTTDCDSDDQHWSSSIGFVSSCDFYVMNEPLYGYKFFVDFYV